MGVYRCGCVQSWAACGRGKDWRRDSTIANCLRKERAKGPARLNSDKSAAEIRGQIFLKTKFVSSATEMDEVSCESRELSETTPEFLKCT